ncbi:MAG TPA: prolipoprotein diacylglyceryl transferase [Thermoanaerobaculia bacterium]|nr:prolipoprotein diacylglyceryl transferase [Thermoanaerobaculia bacterium]
MFPTLFKYGSFEITTFGLMMFLAFVVGGWVLTRQFRRYGLPEDEATNVLLAAALGGIIGAKIYYAILYNDLSLMFTRAGLVWYGGLLGGTLAVTWVIWRKRLPFFRVADAVAPGLAIGYCLGRIGCFLVGDDYGRPTESFVGVAFPKGAPPTTARSLREFGVTIDPLLPDDAILRVHPTQLYEAGAALLMFLILLSASKRPHVAGRVLGLFLILMGIERFLVEFVRAKDDRFLGPFTLAQLISVIIFAIGLWMAARRSGAEVEAA